MRIWSCLDLNCLFFEADSEYELENIDFQNFWTFNFSPSIHTVHLHAVEAPDFFFFFCGGGIEGVKCSSDGAKIQKFAENGWFWPCFSWGGGKWGGRASDWGHLPPMPPPLMPQCLHAWGGETAEETIMFHHFWPEKAIRILISIKLKTGT